MRLGGTDLEVVVADITALEVDAIANVANAALEPSAGDGTSL
jgi:O-acetyl-ADP-ribose deacetylase (regulator of RNase III)